VRVVNAAPQAEQIDGGWALGEGPRRALLSYLPAGRDDLEPATALCDAWEPPHALSVPPDGCDALLHTATTVQATPSPNGTYFKDCLGDPLDTIVWRAEAANRTWWKLEVDTWYGGLKRYGVGDRHPAHTDWHPGASRRKLAGVVQLSDPDDYEGGALVVHGPAGQRLEMPKTRGTFITFPGWVVHEVKPVTAGERWSLCWNGWGPPLR